MRRQSKPHLLRLSALVLIAVCLISIPTTLAYYTDTTDHVVNSHHFDESLFSGEEEPQEPDENPQPSEDGTNPVDNGTVSASDQDDSSSGSAATLPSIGPSPETGTIGSLMIWNILSVLLTAFALLIIWKPGREKTLR